MSSYNAAWDESAQLIASTQTSALSLDASQYSHPIVQTVNDPAEIDGVSHMHGQGREGQSGVAQHYRVENEGINAARGGATDNRCCFATHAFFTPFDCACLNVASCST